MRNLPQAVTAWGWRVVAAAGRRVVHPLAVAVSEKEHAYGLVLVDFSSEIEESGKFEAVKDALRMIECYDPGWTERLAAHVNQIVIARIPGAGGEYWNHSRSIVLDVQALQRQSAMAIAMLIVHEGTHARLWKRGLGRHPDREAIERICVRAEIAFASRVPNSERLIEGARAKLQSRWWEAPQTTDRMLRRIDELPLPRMARRVIATAIAWTRRGT
jgi:hypothetical protein